MTISSLKCCWGVLALAGWLGLGLARAVLAQEEGLPTDVQEALAQAGIPLGAVSVVVQDLAAAVPVVRWNGAESRRPASLMKLVTTYSALAGLGPAYTWETRVRGSYPEKGVMAGDLYVEGSGDPALSLERWQTLLRDLRILGVQRIRGNLVLDTSAFAPPLQEAGAFDHQAYRTYNTMPEALQVGFKAVTLRIEVANGQVRALPDFDFPELRVENRLRVSDEPCPANWKGRLERTVEDDGEHARIRLRGSFPASCGVKTLSFSVFSNERFILYAFRKIWKELGGTFTGTVVSGQAPEGSPVLAVTRSPSLADVLRDINKYSNNLMARTLFLDLGRTGEGPATPEKAAAQVRRLLQARGLDFQELVLENGAGLSRRESITADHLNALLRAAHQDPFQPEFESSLPLAGLDGTLATRLQEPVVQGRFHLKTGSLDEVSGIAGYGRTPSGKEVTVVFLVNHSQADAARSAQDALLRWIARTF